MLLKGWERQLILRLDIDTGSESSDVPHVCHKYPFTSLPYLKSHIRPQFAIFNAGAKLMRALEEHKDLIEGSPDILFVMNLYEAWTRELPPNCNQDQSYYPPNPSHDTTDTSDDDYVDDEDPDYDDQTSDRKRKGKAAQRVPRKKPKRKREQKVSGPSRPQLPSKITLSRLERLGRASWTCNSIRKWANPPRIRRGTSNYTSCSPTSLKSLNYVYQLYVIPD